MTRQTVQSPSAYTAGPYSHGVWAGDLFYLSGQAAVDPATGKLVPGDVSAQAAQCFKNLFTVLTARRAVPPAGDQGQRLPGRYGRLRRHECRLRRPIRKALPRPHHRGGSLAAARRTHRDRAHRPPRIAPAHYKSPSTTIASRKHPPHPPPAPPGWPGAEKFVHMRSAIIVRVDLPL